MGGSRWNRLELISVKEGSGRLGGGSRWTLMNTHVAQLALINPYAPSAIFIHGQNAPGASFRKYHAWCFWTWFPMDDFDATWKNVFWLHKKMYFGHISLNNGPIWQIKKPAYSWECPLSFHAITRAFSCSGSIRGFALFHTLGELSKSSTNQWLLDILPYLQGDQVVTRLRF